MVLHLAWLYVSGNLRPMAEAAKAVALRCSQDSNRMFTLFRSRFYRLKLADHAALQMMATGELSTAAFNGAPSSNKIVFGYPYVQCPFLIRRPACQVRRLVIDYSQTEKCVGNSVRCLRNTPVTGSYWASLAGNRTRACATRASAARVPSPRQGSRGRRRVHLESGLGSP